GASTRTTRDLRNQPKEPQAHVLPSLRDLGRYRRSVLSAMRQTAAGGEFAGARREFTSRTGRLFHPTTTRFPTAGGSERRPTANSAARYVISLCSATAVLRGSPRLQHVSAFSSPMAERRASSGRSAHVLRCAPGPLVATRRLHGARHSDRRSSTSH